MAGERPPTVRGFEFAEVRSALQKAIRRGDVQGAVAWAAEIEQSGYHRYVWRVMRVICSEDVGLAEPGTMAELLALEEAYRRHIDTAIGGRREGSERLFVVHAAILLARARKSRLCDAAIWAAYAMEEPLVSEIPDEALDMHTPRGKEMGRGWDHWIEESSRLDNEHPDPSLDERGSPFWARYTAIKERSRFWYRGLRQAKRTTSSPQPQLDLDS